MKLLSTLSAVVLVVSIPFSNFSFAQVSEPGMPGVLFQNVRVFNGKSGTLSPPSNVLVYGNKIEKISTSPIMAIGPPRVIDGRGMTLMPGLIDMHWHTMLVRPTVGLLLTGDLGYMNLMAADEANDTLMRGFTTVRDLGGPAFGLKRAIDEGMFPGPRIYPSGAIITVTSGHGDFRNPNELPRTIGAPLSRQEMTGAAAVADSPDEVRARVREQLLQGASQIKLTGGGGVSSPNAPLDAVTFTVEELRAAVEAAENWGTYVAVHAYTPQAIRRAIEAGAKCIDHGHLMDDATAKLMADKGIWLSMQPIPPEAASVFPVGSGNYTRAMQVVAGVARTYELAKKHKIKTAWGSDVLFSAALAQRQGALLSVLGTWFTPAETLIMATSTNAELLNLSGKRNPYEGKLGVVEEGAFADLLLVNGNPLENLALVADPAKNFVVIMKDGKIHKNTLSGGNSVGGAATSIDPPTLEGNRWTLTSAKDGQNNAIDLASVNKRRPVVFTFSDGTLGVQGPCNQLAGSFTGDGRSTPLVVGQMRRTMMACDPAVMEAESKLSKMLEGPLQVELDGSSHLRLVSSANGTLSFDGKPTPESLHGPAKIIFLEVAPQRVACSNPNGERTCVQVRDRFYNDKGLQSAAPGPWRPLYQNIEGFTHVPGQRNVLRVKRFSPSGSRTNVYVLDMTTESEIVR